MRTSRPARLLAAVLLAMIVASAPARAQTDDLARLRAALGALGLEEVRVSAQAGVVRLEGQVGSPGEREAAEEIARRSGSWIYVANRLEVAASGEREAEATELDRDIESRLRGVFAQVGELSGLRVDVESGIVHLRGRAPDDDALERAVALARRQDGVIFVDSRVRVDRSIRARLDATWARFVERAGRVAALSPLYLVALVIVALGGFAASRVVERKRRRKNPLLRAMARQALAALVLFAAVLLALDLLEATALLGAVAGTAGVLGLALGFAFKDIIENYLAGVLLALRNPFSPGDLVRIGDDEGKVVRLTARDTVLITLDGNHVRLPNAHVFKTITTNYSINPLRRFEVKAGIGQGEDLTRAQHVGVEALRGMKGVVDDPAPFAWVEELGASTVTVRYYGWVDQRAFDFLKVESEATRRVKVALDAAGVELPFPTYVIRRNAERARSPDGGQAHDVERDDVIDRQVRADRERSEEGDLLAEGSS